MSEVEGTLADVTDNAHPHPSPSSADAHGAASGTAAAVPDSSALRLFTVEVGAWLSILAAAALAFGAAGTFGVAAFVDPADLQDIHAATVADTFAARPAILLYAAVLAAAVAGVFVPHGRLGGATALRVALVAACLMVALAVLSLFVVWALVPVGMGLCVGAVFAAILSMVRTSRAKPWRSAGVAAGITLVVTYAAQLLGGADGGHAVMPWLALLGGAILLLGLLLMLRSQPQGDIWLPDTGAHPLERAAIARPASPVSSAWPCHLLFAVLGAVGILAQPSVAELGFGQGGMSLIICAVLLGWAVGFETGPHFAPGMTRTRLTTFALITAGVLTIGTGLLGELSGRAVLSGGVAFLVGLGVRAQRYAFSRRIGALAGMAGAVVVTALGVSGEVPLSEHVAWAIRPADVSYVLVGLVAVVGGVVALFTFGPTGIRGLGVDVVHAFRLPQTSRPAGGQPPAAVQLQESEAAEAPSTDAAGDTEAAQAAEAGEPAAPESAVRESAGQDYTDQDYADQESLAVLSDGQSPHPAAAPVGLDAGRGFFIALEGGDGTGKSTQIHLLAEALRDRGAREVVTTREPGGTEAGTKLRSVVLDGDGVTTRAEALVFAADRAHHVASLIRPVLERGGIVITDRYIDSSRAYQAAGRDLGDEEITALSRWATEGLQPDLTIVLDANPAVTRQRTGGRGDQNHLDLLDLQFHTAVRQAFLDFAHAAPQKYAVVDAGRDIDTVASRVLEVVDERMRNRALPDDGSEDETRVVRRVPAAQEPASDQVPEPDEMPASDETPEPSEMPTQVHVRAQEPARSADAEVDPSEAPTTVHPVTPPPPPVVPPAPSTAEARQSSRERLRAQAEIERRARERLRAQRDGGGRGDYGDRGPGGAGSR